MLLHDAFVRYNVVQMNEILNPQSYFSPRFDLPYKNRSLYLADTRRQNAANSTVSLQYTGTVMLQ